MDIPARKRKSGPDYDGVVNLVRRLRPVFPIGAAYFVGAVISLFLARLHDRVPFVWLSASVMIAFLRVRPVSKWPPVVAVCAPALFLASSLFGGGWIVAIPMTIINMTEGIVGAYLLNRARALGHSLGTVGWMLEFAIPIGLVSPAVTAVLVWLLASATGFASTGVAFQMFCGHALGNLMFTPLTRVVARHGVASLRTELLQHGKGELVGLLLAVAGITVCAFSQESIPLLFLPFVPMILVAFRLGFAGSAIGMMVIATVAGYYSLHGHGPTELMSIGIDGKIHFLQFYLIALVLTMLPVAADLKNRSDLHRAMQLSEQRYRLMAEHSTDILLHVEFDGRIRYASPSIRQTTGFDPSEVVGSRADSFVAPDHARRVRQGHLATIAARGRTHSYEYIALTANGDRRWFESHSRAIVDQSGEVDGLLCVVRDIDDHKKRELQLSLDAMTDVLTGLPNRRAYELAVEQRLADRRDKMPDCIALFDIDRFKRVNDEHGHDAGDAILVSFARVLRQMAREGDTVARLGGEEFVALFPATSIPQALSICERLRSQMAATVTHVAGEAIRVTISGGVALLSEQGLDVALKRADRALYVAKRSGRDQMALAA